VNLRKQPVFTIAFIVLLFLAAGRAYPSFGSLSKVWADMVSGRPFDVFLFAVEWVLIFLIFYKGGQKLLPIPGALSHVIHKKSRAATEDETDHFKRMLRLEEGPAILKSGIWMEDLKTTIAETVHRQGEPKQGRNLSGSDQGSPGKAESKEGPKEMSADAGPVNHSQGSNLLVMDLEEAAGSTNQNENSLSRKIEDLLNEQETVIFGEGLTKDSGDSQQNREISIDPEENEFDGSSMMRVVYRSAPASEQIPGFLQKAFAARKDPSFYKELKELLST